MQSSNQILLNETNQVKDQRMKREEGDSSSYHSEISGDSAGEGEEIPGTEGPFFLGGAFGIKIEKQEEKLNHEDQIMNSQSAA